MLASYVGSEHVRRRDGQKLLKVGLSPVTGDKNDSQKEKCFFTLQMLASLKSPINTQELLTTQTSYF
jgi:hypothetical protein